MRVQHNIPAMNAYRNYTNNTKAINKNLEKLSSGYRINRAGDDAAGLAISEKMRAQITGLATAQKNAKDGISLIQTAEGALTEVHSMLNRMFELAEQSANGTYDNEVDRANLQKEFDALRSEIDRIADSSNFNGTKLLDGSLTSAFSINDGKITNFTYGAGAAQIPTVGNTHDTKTILSGKATTETVTSFQVDFGNLVAKGTAAADVTLSIGGVKLQDTASTPDDITLGAIGADGVLDNATIMNSVKGLNGQTLSLTVGGKQFEFDATVDEKGILTLTQTDATIATEGHYKIDAGAAVTIGGGTVEVPTSFNQTTINNVQGEAAKPAQRANTFFTLTADMVRDGAQLTIGDKTYTFAVGKDSQFAKGKDVIDLTDYNADLAAITTGGLSGLEKAGQLLSQKSDGNGVFTIGFDGTNKISVEEREGQKVMDLSTEAGMLKAFGTGKAISTSTGGKGLTLQIGDTADSFNMLTVDVADMHAVALGIDASKINIDKQGDAQSAMDAIKTAINSVSSTRGDLGALQNRLDHTINNLSVMEENITDAESSIRDTDVAKEMMAYTKNNILIQASQAMLAQANQLPQGVLQLMG